MINLELIQELTKQFKDARYRECNYYMADTLLATTAIVWVTERLEGHLAHCLNVSDGYCNVWYLDSHTECKKLMSILYELTANKKYVTKL